MCQWGFFYMYHQNECHQPLWKVLDKSVSWWTSARALVAPATAAIALLLLSLSDHPSLTLTVNWRALYRSQTPAQFDPKNWRSVWSSASAPRCCNHTNFMSNCLQNKCAWCTLKLKGHLKSHDKWTMNNVISWQPSCVPYSVDPNTEHLMQC